MKVFHIPFCFAPDPVGGTEVYVDNLVRDLQKRGLDVMVVAPGSTNRAYKIDGLRVRRFAANDNVTDVGDLYGSGDPLAAAEFAKSLDDEAPDLVHVHAFTSAVSLRLVQACKSRGIPVVYTYHTPTVTCQRGTLMLWGETCCDGKLAVGRCAGCTLQGLGIHRRLAKPMGLLPPSIGRWLGNLGMQGDIWTAFRMGELISMRHTAFREMALEVDHFVAVCDWVRDVLLINDVPAAKVSVSRHGISWTPHQETASTSSSNRDESHGVRIAFVGRLDPSKGLHILIDVFRSAPTLKLSLDVFGVTQSSASSAYQNKMLALAGSDPRISFHGAIPSSEVVPRLRQYDFLAVPSQWMETGPLVALEAFAAGIPVIGWDLGGIAELVRNEVDGLLIEPSSVARWGATLHRVAGDAKLRARLKAGVRPPRTSTEVTREMLALYHALLGKRPEAANAS